MIPGCSCPVPTFHPVHADTCGRCRKILDPRIVDSDENLAVFTDRLKAIPGFPVAALEHAHAREVAGRKQFGLEYLNRNNPVEGCEEAADGINYSFYHWLRQRREGVEEINPRLLAAARYFALAYEELRLAEGDNAFGV